MADTTKTLCPHCKQSFGAMEEPCRKCEGAKLIIGPKNKQIVCPRCNATGLNISAQNRHNRTKGASNERKAVAFFTDFWTSPTGEKYAWRKTPQSGGMSLAAEFKMSGDIATTAPDFPFGVECKRDASFSLSNIFNSNGSIIKFIAQVEEDNADNNKIPMLWLMNPGPSQPTWIMLIADSDASLYKMTALKNALGKSTPGWANGVIKTPNGNRWYILTLLENFAAVGTKILRETCNE
jgi:hypothetical protein